MLRFIATRLVQSLVALAIVSVVVFVLARATGDPLYLILPMSASQEDFDNARRYVVFFDLLFSRFVEKAIAHPFTYDEQPSRFQTAHHALEDFAKRHKLVIRVSNQNSIKSPGREFGVRRFAENDLDIGDGVILSTLTQLVE